MIDNGIVQGQNKVNTCSFKEQISCGNLVFGNYGGTCEATLMADETAMEEQAVQEQSLLDPDTDGEKSYSATLTQGIPVYLYFPEDYVLYTDCACTQVDKAQSGDTTKDATIYVKADAE